MMTLKLVNLFDNTVVVVLSSKVYPTCKHTTRQQRQCWMNLGIIHVNYLYLKFYQQVIFESNFPAIALIQLLTKPNHNITRSDQFARDPIGACHIRETREKYL